MNSSAEVGDVARALTQGLRSVSECLVGRDHVVELAVLSAVAREHLLILGPPGTGKSEIARRVAGVLGSGAYFEYLLGRFTEPGELFGPVDLKKLSEGALEIRTAGMLPEAEVAFLDEVFLGSTAILNTLLGILNERVFRRGATVQECPLRLCIAAANGMATDPALAAFADRFLVSVHLEAVSDSQLEELLERGAALDSRPPVWSDGGSRDAGLDVLIRAAASARLSGVRAEIARAVRMLRGAGLSLSDRRIVRAQRLVAAAAVLAGRSEPSRADLWPLIYVVPDAEGQILAREVLGEILQETHSEILPTAAEHASRAPQMRAARLREVGAALLDAGPGEERGAWLLRLEGVAREIDATLAPEHRGDLVGLRAQIEALLATGAKDAGARGDRDGR